MKTTLATIKSFIRKNSDNLFINEKSSFDGMTDCCESLNNGFQKVQKAESNFKNNLGIQGAWFVGNSRDYFYTYNENGYIGYEISNSCGHFILAKKMKTTTFNNQGRKVNVNIPGKELSDDNNPSFAFSTMSTELLTNFAKGKYEIDFYLKAELINRGLNINGQWIGFANARKEFKL